MAPRGKQSDKKEEIVKPPSPEKDMEPVDEESKELQVTSSKDEDLIVHKPISAN